MATVVISAYDVVNYPQGGGHFWVYLQYVLGLRLLGHDVYWLEAFRDRKSTRLNSSHSQISYAVFCLKKKKKITTISFKIPTLNTSTPTILLIIYTESRYELILVNISTRYYQSLISNLYTLLICDHV